MVPYYFLIGIPLVLSLFKYNDDKKIFNKRFPILVFFLMFITLLSLRSVRCGTDLLNYSNKFDNLQNISIKTLFDFSILEPGYTFFVSMCKLLINDFQFLLFACAVISIVPIMLLYLKESTHSALTVALFVSVAPFTMFFSGLRQSIAIGLGAICYHFCKEKKLLQFSITVFVAFLFHQSAVILALMYPLMYARITKRWILPMAALYAVCLIYNKQIFGIIVGLNEKYESRYVISDTGSYTFLVLLLIFTVYSFIMLRDDAEEVFGLRNLLLLSLFLQCFVPVNIVAMRLNYYYMIFIPITIPYIVDNCKERYRQIATLSVFVMVSFLIYWFFKDAYTGKNILQAFPYIPFWED